MNEKKYAVVLDSIRKDYFYKSKPYDQIGKVIEVNYLGGRWVSDDPDKLGYSFFIWKEKDLVFLTDEQAAVLNEKREILETADPLGEKGIILYADDRRWVPVWIYKYGLRTCIRERKE